MVGWAAHEIMIGTPAIRNLIRENKLAQMYSAIQTGQQFGMQTLDQNLKALLSKNLITKIDARSKAANKDDFLEDKESKMDRDNAIKEMRELLKLMIEKKALICL